MSIILSWIVQPRDRNANYNIDMLRSETKKHAISAVMNWDYNGKFYIKTNIQTDDFFFLKIPAPK